MGDDQNCDFGGIYKLAVDVIKEELEINYLFFMQIIGWVMVVFSGVGINEMTSCFKRMSYEFAPMTEV